MPLELIVSESDDYPELSIAQVVLNGFFVCNLSSLPTLTPECVSMGELERQLAQLEGQI